MKKILIIFITLSFIISCEEKPVTSIPEPKGELILGGKNGYTENRIAFKILSIYLKELGYKVTEVPEINIISGYDALLDKHIDIYCEYTGTILSLLTDKSIPDPIKAYELAKKRVAEDGAVLMNMAPSNNTYKIFLKKDIADKYSINTFSDVAKLINNGTIDPVVGAGVECIMDHLDCLQGLEYSYNFKIKDGNTVILDPKRLYEALENYQIDMAVCGSAEGQRLKFDPKLLIDDKNFFSAYNIAPITRKDIVEKYPELPEKINMLFDMLTQKELLAISYKIDGQNEEIILVLREWLKSKNLI